VTDYLKLFGPDGTEIPATRKNQLKIEQRNFSERLYRRVLCDKPGTYWLISARPGHVRMLLQMLWLKDRDTNEWSMSFVLNGIAGYSHWNIESVMDEFKSGREPVGDEYGYTHVPANVEQLAREHVYFVSGAEDEDDKPRSQFSIQTLDADKMSAALNKVVPTGTDISSLLKLAGRKVEIVELGLAAAFFCGEQDQEKRELEIMRAMVPFRSRLRLRVLQAMLGAQLANG
jgi:hypothetical protein